MRKLSFALAMLLGNADAFAADPARSLELVEASRADLPLVGLFKEAVQVRLTEFTDVQKECFRKVPDDAFQQAAVDYFARLLTDTEVAQAMAFYATPVGKKLAANNSAARGQPLPLELSRKEYEQQEAFSFTRAGNELLTPNGLLQSAEVKQRYEKLFFQKVKECGGPR
jgi:hypothetical protein